MCRTMNVQSDKVISVKIAGQNIVIECIHDKVIRMFQDYYAVFDKPDFEIHISEEEIISEYYKRIIDLTAFEHVAITVPKEAFELVAIHRKTTESMLRYDTLLIHGSVIAKGNSAFMFTAPSGTGKSTRTRIWLNEYPDSFVINGDKPYIRITNAEVTACGTPWCGKEGWNTNTMVPLQAIFLLTRANKDEKSTIEEVSLGDAFPFLLQQTFRPSDSILMYKTIKLLKALDGKVRIFNFRSTPTPEAIRLAYETACMG